MRVIISHTTALRWYLTRSRAAFEIVRETLSIDEFKCPDARMGSLLASSFGCGKHALDLLVGRGNMRRSYRGVHCHVAGDLFPAGSFVRIPCSIESVELYIVSPELLYMQLCRGRSIAEAALIGTTLCSLYWFDPSRDLGLAQRAENEVLTTSQRISAYVGRRAGTSLRGIAAKALPYIYDRSRSPRETGLAGLYGLPVRYGGFQLGDIALNERVAIRLPHGESIRREPDIRISVKGVDGKVRTAYLDYDSVRYHSSAWEQKRDARRRNELALAGIVHFTVTAEQANDFYYLCNLAERIRLVLKERPHPRLKGGVASPKNAKRLDEVRHKQFELWKAIVNDAFNVWDL